MIWIHLQYCGECWWCSFIDSGKGWWIIGVGFLLMFCFMLWWHWEYMFGEKIVSECEHKNWIVLMDNALHEGRCLDCGKNVNQAVLLSNMAKRLQDMERRGLELLERLEKHEDTKDTF